MKHWHRCKRWTDQGFYCPYWQLPDAEHQKIADDRLPDPEVPEQPIPVEGPKPVRIPWYLPGRKNPEKRGPGDEKNVKLQEAIRIKMEKQIEEILDDAEKSPVPIPDPVIPPARVPPRPAPVGARVPVPVARPVPVHIRRPVTAGDPRRVPVRVPVGAAVHATEKVAQTVPRYFVPTKQQLQDLRGAKVRVPVPRSEVGPRLAYSPQRGGAGSSPVFKAALAEKVVTQTLGQQELGPMEPKRQKIRTAKGGAGIGKYVPAAIGAAAAAGGVAGGGFFFNAARRMAFLTGQTAH